MNWPLKCPVCEGSGQLHRSGRHMKTMPMIRKRELTYLLHEAGYSHREIMRVVGWEDIAKVRNVLNHNRAPGEGFLRDVRE